MALRRAAGVRRIAGEKDAPGAKAPCDLGVAIEARGDGDPCEAHRGPIASQGGRGIGDEIGFGRARLQMDAPAPLRQGGQNDWDLVEIGIVRLEESGQSLTPASNTAQGSVMS